MRGKRAKQYRKLMTQYQLGFGFRAPYQILLDADIIQTAAQLKMNFTGMLERTLQGEIKPMITQCCMRHLYEANDQTIIEHAKGFERRRCGHHTLEKPLTAMECLSEVIDPKSSLTNKHRYVVASQNPKMRAMLRRIPGVPLIYINRSVMILEPIATATSDVRDQEEQDKLKAGLKGRRGATEGAKRKREVEDDGAQGHPSSNSKATSDASKQPERKRRKGEKGPNPLSVKKPKPRVPEPSKSKDHAKSPAEEQPKNIEVPTATEDTNPALGESEETKRKRKRKHKSRGASEPAPPTMEIEEGS
ncbi:putative rRNA-processing protein utp23 [Mytilinidion resinicola]|uniref:U three protein 23 n=1 Tax=Mytilinidion resinicola TaxID=574789 RepID=A0A6A6YL03_9PEZI|nr:putative rRNA-processing protein utp23 [Mytilinidion resinicola]KAF2808547.1 putative rRNA-processing protein utp23 [Mytilinidion resinicola]